MLNMLDTQDKLKNFSEQQLIQEMQMPTGSAPQFMVLGEIERRKRMRADAQRQEGLMQPTVAQEAVSAAGVPQQGIAQVAQSLAPKTDMTQNTGVPNVQAAGLPSQPNQPVKMADGGLLSSMHTDPSTVALASRMGMSVDDYISTLSPAAIEANLQRIARTKANKGRVYGDVFDPTRPAYDQANRLELDETFDQLKSNIRDEETMALGVNPSFATDTRDRAFGIGISDRGLQTPPTVGTAPTRPAEGLEVLRSMDVPALQGRLVKDEMLSGPDLAQGTTDNPAPSGTFADEELVMSRPVSVSRRPGFRAGDDIKVLGFGGQTIAELQSIIDNPESTTGEVEAAKTRLAAARGTESVLQGTSNVLEATPGAAYTLARPTLDAVSDAYALTGRVGNKIVDATGRVVSLASPDAGAAILDMAASNEEAYNRAASRFNAPETEDPMSQPVEVAADADTGTPLKVPSTGIADLLPDPEAARATTVQDRAAEIEDAVKGTGSKKSGGSGGKGAAKKSGIEAAKSKMDQDKWLALAQAGFELMSSGDFGKAGQAGLASLRQAKADDMAERKLEAELMLREAQLAAANRKGTASTARPIPVGIIGNLEARRAEIQQALAGLEEPTTNIFGNTKDPDADARTALTNQLEEVNTQIQYAYATQGVPFSANAASGGNPQLDARDK